MANFAYKKTITSKMKLSGLVDTDRMVIDIDGEEKDIQKMFSDFSGAMVEITIGCKDEQELTEP